MKRIEEAQKILRKIAELLRYGDVADWAEALESLERDMSADPERVFAQIPRLYGGVGSLNDIVLYRRGRLLGPESNELDALRVRLHSLCRYPD